MSLQLWLPLNGNYQNQGLLNVTPTSSSATFADGNLGKCLVSPGSVTISSSNINYKNFSVAFWVKCKSGFTGDWKRILILNTKNTKNGTSGNLRFEQAQTSFRALSTHNNTSYDIDNGSTIYSNAVNTWMHVVYTYESNSGNIKAYLNGNLLESRTSTKPGGQLNGYVELASNYEGWICDFRLYDDIISPKEVKEISKGLALHFPLNDQHELGIVNKYSGDNAKGLASAKSTEFIVTPLTNENGYNYKLTYTGNGENRWANMQFPNFSFNVGKKYFYSCKIRCHADCNVNFHLRASRASNDWVTNTINVINTNNTDWKEFVVSQTINATFDRSGSTVTSNPCLEFYTDNMSTNEKIYKLDFDIKDVQVIESDEAVPYIDNMFVSSTVSECSGLSKHGVVSGPINYTKTSPRYVGCYKFGADSHIKIPRPFVASISSTFTISLWVKPNSGCGGYSTILSNFNSLGANGFWLAINTEGNGVWFYNGNYLKAGSALALNSWHHIVITFNAGIVTSYVNGVKTGSADVTASDKAIAFSEYIAVGNSYTGTSWNTDFVGEISDLRMYSVVLSETDIKELYNTPISLSKDGTLFSHEFEEV